MPSEGGARKGVAMTSEKIYKINNALEGAQGALAGVLTWVLTWIRAERSLFKEGKGIAYTLLIVIVVLVAFALIGRTTYLVEYGW